MKIVKKDSNTIRENLFNYDAESHNATLILDDYDLSNILQTLGGRNLQGIQSAIANVYPQLEKSLDNLTNDEFITYFEDRYGVKFFSTEIWYLGNYN